MQIQNIHDYYKTRLPALRALAAGSSLWKDDAAALIAREDAGFTDADTLLQGLQEFHRLNSIIITNLENDAPFRADVLAKASRTWKDFISPPVDLELQHTLAKKLYNTVPGSKDVAFMNIGDYAREIAAWLADRLVADKTPFVVGFADADFNALVLNAATTENVEKLAQDFLAMTANVNKRIVARPGLSETKPIKADKDKSSLFSKITAPFHAKSGTGEVFYTLTVLPTPKDAEVDGIAYDDYIKLFFEMCDQPWDRISTAQLLLINEFNAATKVRITNNDGTDVSMELVDHDGSHFTFCNSLIAKNVPGSEIFSAPRRDSVNGIVVAKGRFSEHGHGMIENLTMEFKNGELIRYNADKGLEDFRQIIAVDDGARFVGELGIGTNPHLKQHVCNGLLVEKIGGSFHLALGRPYSYTEYVGVPVKVDNGGKSDLHWDITTMLHGKGGRIYLDGRMVMDDGKWLAAQYDVLNRGWECVPVADRPDYWKNYYTKQPAP